MANSEYSLPLRNGKLVGRKFIEFFFPSVLMAASASLSIIIDSIIVGNVLGANELAAMNLILPISLCFTAISGMFGIGSATCISMFKGKMDSENANKSLTLSFIAWLFFSIIAIGLGLFANNTVAAFLSGTSGLTDLVSQYLKVYLLGAPFTFATLIFPHIIKADGKARFSSNSLIIANALNLCLDIVYMKFMHMGLAGGALATITGNVVGTFFYIIYIKSKSRTLYFAKIKKSDLRLYADMFKMGISSIFGQGLMFAKMWIFNMIIAAIAGQAGLTAFSICTSCLSFVSMFIAGAAQTMMPMVGAFNGADDNTAIGLTVKKSLKIILSCCIVITILFELFPSIVMGIYGVTDGEALEIGIRAVRLFSLALTGIGFSFMFMYYVQANSMPSFSMQICALEGFFVIVPLCLILSLLFGENGIWISYTVNEILVALFILLKSKHIVKKSDGKLYSMFMLKKNNQNILELSVDVFNENEVSNMIGAVENYVAQKYSSEVNVKEILQNMCKLSKTAYTEAGCRREGIADIIVDDGKISFKDMGKNYKMINSAEYTENLKKINKNYDNTLMIGMNYSSIGLC